MHIAPRRLARTGFGLAMVILGLVSVGSYQAVSALIESTRLVSHAHESVEAVERLTAEVIEVESTCRGYVLSGADDFLKFADVAVARVRRTLNRVREYTRDDPSHAKSITGLEPLIERKLAFHLEAVKVRRAQRLRRRDADVRDRRGPRAHAEHPGDCRWDGAGGTEASGAANGRRAPLRAQGFGGFARRHVVERRNSDPHLLLFGAGNSPAPPLRSPPDPPEPPVRRADARQPGDCPHFRPRGIARGGVPHYGRGGRLPHGLGGSARSPVAMRAPHGAVRA